jgi:uncharacterized protein with PIN domain
MIELAIIFGVLMAGLALVAWGTVAKNRWGINLQPNVCPRCKAALPQVRKPRSMRQMLWGGSTCPACGAEIDKWGREIVYEGFPFDPRRAVVPWPRRFSDTADSN